MKYRLEQKVRINAGSQFVWDLIAKTNHKYFEHIAYFTSGVRVNKEPTKVENNRSLIWDAREDKLELARYQDVLISRDLKRVTYDVEGNEQNTIVSLILEFECKVTTISGAVHNYFEIRPIVKDNLLWFKTMVEDQFEEARQDFSVVYA